MNEMLKIVIYLLAISLLGCGAGGNQNPIPQGVDLTYIYGDWTEIQANCQPSSNTSLAEYYKTVKIEVRLDHVLLVRKVYSDDNCNTEKNEISDWYDTKWFNGPSGLLNSVTANLTYVGLYTSSNHTINKVNSSERNLKVMFIFKDELLNYYEGGLINDIDSEGYPLGTTQPTGIYE